MPLAYNHVSYALLRYSTKRTVSFCCFLLFLSLLFSAHTPPPFFLQHVASTAHRGSGAAERPPQLQQRCCDRALYAAGLGLAHCGARLCSPGEPPFSAAFASSSCQSIALPEARTRDCAMAVRRWLCSASFRTATAFCLVCSLSLTRCAPLHSLARPGRPAPHAPSRVAPRGAQAACAACGLFHRHQA